MIKNITAYILWTGKKSVTIAPECYPLTVGDVVRVFCGYCTISHIIRRKDDNITLILK